MPVKPALRVLKQRLKRINTRLILFAVISATFRTRIYRRVGAKLLSEAPKFQITNLWPGNVNQGLVIMEGDFEFLGTQIRDSDMPWMAKNVSGSIQMEAVEGKTPGCHQWWETVCLTG